MKFLTCLMYLLGLDTKIDALTKRMEEEMATKDDVLTLAGQLEGAIASETAEITLVIEQKTKAAVAEAVAPLLTQVSNLTDQLANAAGPGGVVFTQAQVDTLKDQLQKALAAIAAEVTPEPVDAGSTTPPVDSGTPPVVDTPPVNTTPVDSGSTAPVDTAPVNTAPVDTTVPADSGSVSTPAPVNSTAPAQPVVSAPGVGVQPTA